MDRYFLKSRFCKGILFTGVFLFLFLLFLPCAATAGGETMKIEFSGLADVLPWGETPGALSLKGLRLYSCRETARPSERWIAVIAKLDIQGKNFEGTQLRAIAVEDKDFSAPLAEAKSVVAGSNALISVDMRKTGREKVRLRVEWTDKNGGFLGAGETWISAASVKPLAAGTRIPVRIDIPPGVETIENYPVRFGVPLPPGTVWEEGGLRVIDGAGREIPSQLEIAGRWAEEGSVKWMWVDALVSGKRDMDIYVEAGERSSSGMPAVPLDVRKEGKGFLVSTGAAEYLVGNDGSLIKEVRYGGKVAAREGRSRGLYLVDQDGRMAKASGEGAAMKLESAGPVSAVIRIEGYYKTPEGENLARHITRLQFTAGRREATAVHTLVLINDTNETWFRDAGWELEVAAGREPKAFFSLPSREPLDVQSISLKGGKNVSILQKEGISLGLKPSAIYMWNWKDREPRTPWVPYMHGQNVFEIRESGETKHIYKDALMGDWAGVAGENSGWMVSCRDAAAQHPKEFEIEENRLNLKLFSSSSGKELDFRMEALMKNWGMLPPERVEGGSEVPGELLKKYLDFIIRHKSNAAGWAKTHELLFSPFDPASNPASLSLLHSGQVFAHVSPGWIRETGVIGAIHPKDRERFPEEEAVIEGLFWVHFKRWDCGAKGGFVDYHAGPHRIVHNYRTGGYSLRSDSWYLYARSADRDIREFAQGSNRAFLDNNMVHWNVPGKTLGLFIGNAASPGTKQERNRVTDLPMHWQGRGDQYELSTVANMDQALLDYYITGYRRAGDILENFAGAARKTLTSEKVHWRALLTMRHIAQAYEFTWEPRLKELLYEINDKYVYDPESEVLLTKGRPYRSSTYKTETDQDTLLILRELLGDPIFSKMAKAIGQNNWDKASILPPIKGQNRATGFIGTFLWEETGDPSIISGFDYARRRLVADRLVDLETGEVKLTCTSQIPRFFKGLPLAMDILVRTGALNSTPASWIAFKADKSPISLFVKKPGQDLMAHNAPVKEVETPMKILVRKEGSASVEHAASRTENNLPMPATAGGNVVLKPHVVLGNHPWAGHDLHTVTEKSNRVTRVNIPRDAPGGVYEIVINEPGVYSVFSDLYAPLVLYAPEGWTPPGMNPPVRTYFGVSGKKGKIFFEKETSLFMPGGKAFKEGEKLSGWVELPGDSEGLWSFESVEPGMVKTENLPGFFAVGDPALYMEHEWKGK